MISSNNALLPYEYKWNCHFYSTFGKCKLCESYKFLHETAPLCRDGIRWNKKQVYVLASKCEKSVPEFFSQTNAQDNVESMGDEHAEVEQGNIDITKVSNESFRTPPKGKSPWKW